jgi:tetratricopeptide (TPR) repeat protein
VTSWLEGTGAGEDDGPDGATRVTEDLEAVAKVLPAPFVIDELARRYRIPRTPVVHRGSKPSLRALRELMGEDRAGTRAYELVRLFARVSELARARTELQGLQQRGALKGDDAELARMVERVLARDTQPADWVGLAMVFVKESRERGVDDRDVALHVCRDAAARFDKAIEPRLCTGQLALSMEQLVVAMRSFEAVRAIDPARREAWEALARIYQARLFQVVTEENLDVTELPKQLEKVETFHAEAHKRFPQQPLQPGLAGAVFEVGRGYYNAGKINEAERYLARSVELDASAAALELLGTIRLKRGDAQRAAVLIERAMNTGQGSKEEQLYRRAKLRRLLADAIEAAGDNGVAEATRRGAVEDWDVLLELGLQKEYASEALLERGKVLYQLGDREDALHSFARSIDALPDRGSTYADVIAFLVPRGELAEALDAYHRALGRSEVTDYLKVYCSLWIVDLAQRAGQPEDPLAMAYLRAADGNKWFDDLARWSTGRQSEQELLQRASTPARRAEASFYRGLRALRAGRAEEAKTLWKEVLSTDMMAFFEFDMAGMYLKDGAPAQPRLKIGLPKKPPRAPKSTPRTAPNGSPPPDGSI